MARRIRYYLTISTMSSCPTCGQPVKLLATERVTDRPAFFICFKCEFVGQVGRGPVKNLDE